MVSTIELVAELYSRYCKERGPWYIVTGAGECCSSCNPVPSLMARPLRSSRGMVSLTGSRRASRPTLGSRSSPDKAISESGGRSI